LMDSSATGGLIVGSTLTVTILEATMKKIRRRNTMSIIGDMSILASSSASSKTACNFLEAILLTQVKHAVQLGLQTFGNFCHCLIGIYSLVTGVQHISHVLMASCDQAIEAIAKEKEKEYRWDGNDQS